jgi:hypothetical protein
MGIYKRTIKDWDAEAKELKKRMEKREIKGEFDHLAGNYDDIDDSMSLEEAEHIVFGIDPRYRKDAQFSEEELVREGTHPVIIEELMMHKRMYLEAVELLQKAGEM